VEHDKSSKSNCELMMMNGVTDDFVIFDFEFFMTVGNPNLLVFKSFCYSFIVLSVSDLINLISA